MKENKERKLIKNKRDLRDVSIKCNAWIELVC